MSQPVKLSDALVLDARVVGTAVARSIAGQVEFWARLGRAIEPLLGGDRVVALCQNAQARPLSACLASAASPAGRRRVEQVLAGQPYPHFETASGGAGLLVRIDADGSRTVGRFLNRQFRPIHAKPARR